MDFVGNVLTASPCTAEDNGVPINWRYNVIQGGTCGPSDLNAAARLPRSEQQPAPLGRRGRPINAGDPSSYPARDIDGQARFLGTRPDAGADEAG